MKLKRVAAVLLAGAITSSMVLSGCGNKINENAIAATLGDQEISLGYVNFVARYNQINYDSVFLSYYGEDYWTSEDYVDEDGNTMEDSVKNYVIEDIELAYLLEDHMEEYGVEITDEEMESIKAAASEFMSENTKEAIKEMGATQEYVEDMLYYETVKSKMTEAIEATADTEVTDEECARRTFSYIKIDLAGYTDDSGTYTSYTDEEKAALEENVPLIATLAKSDFEGAAESYSYTVSTYSYGIDEKSEEDGGFCEAVIAAADSMTEGQISDAIEGTDCYYIIRLDSENDEDAAESAKKTIIQERQDAKYTEVTDAYLEEAEFEIDEEQLAKVKFTSLFTVVQEDDSSASEE